MISPEGTLLTVNCDICHLYKENIGLVCRVGFVFCSVRRSSSETYEAEVERERRDEDGTRSSRETRENIPPSSRLHYIFKGLIGRPHGTCVNGGGPFSWVTRGYLKRACPFVFGPRASSGQSRPFCHQPSVRLQASA